jgi:hypothetical protein
MERRAAGPAAAARARRCCPSPRVGVIWCFRGVNDVVKKLGMRVIRPKFPGRPLFKSLDIHGRRSRRNGSAFARSRGCSYRKL